jgi:uncharacterized protein YdhG (YjbR/CyaY superfamily)
MDRDACLGGEMPSSVPTPKTVEEYIMGHAPPVRRILRRIRATIRRAAPAAEESISYRIPTYKQNGALAHFAAFRRHIGFFPPVRGDAQLQQAASAYAGEKGNLKFPLDRPIPYPLIARIVKLRAKQNARKAGPHA